MDETDLSTQIEQAAQEPAGISRDGHTVNNVPIGDLIKADQYLASKRRALQRKSLFGVYRAIPQGTVQRGY
jgi:hypothetical protein